MTEDIFYDGSAGLGDDFSLSSSIDDINYDDPFNSNHNNSDGVETISKMLTLQDHTFNTNLRGMTALSFETSRGQGDMQQITDRCNEQPSSISSSTQPITDQKVQPNKTSDLVPSAKDTKKSKKQPSHLIVKPENVAVKARKTSTKSMIKQSKSDGLLTLALKAKYRKATFQRSRNIGLSSSSSVYSGNRIGDKDEPVLGKANASWNDANGTDGRFRLDNSHSLPPVKSSSMHDLLRQSKAQCKSQFLLQQSSAHSLSKRNSFQSIKYVNEKLDVSSLLPAKQYSKSRNVSARWSFPNVAGATTRSKFSKDLMRVSEVRVRQSTNDGTSDMTESLLHDACRLFPNSDTVIETALRVDPDAVRRPVISTSDQNREASKRSNTCIFGYPINLALTHGASDKILNLLVQSGSDVLAFKDGTDCSASLGIALSSKTCKLATAELLLSANDNCARIADRRGNYPLHVAVSYGRSVDIVMRLYAAYPKAQGMRNFHSQTPLDIAIQSSRCPEDVTDFLRLVSCRSSCVKDSVIDTKKEDANQSIGSLEECLDDIMETNC